MKKVSLALLVICFMITNFGCSTASTTSQMSAVSSSLPEKQIKNSHRFIFMADTRGSDDGINKAVLDKIFTGIKALTPQPEYILVGGDLITGSKDTDTYKKQLGTFKAFFTSYYPIHMLLPAYGNHEDSGSTKEVSHEEIFGEFFNEFSPTNALQGYHNTVYYMEKDHIRFFVLNSYHSGQTSQIVDEQLNWLKENLKKDDNKLDIAFIHSPPYPTGGHVGSSLDMYPEKRDAFWQLLDNQNALALFAGHEHNYTRRIIDSTFSSLFTRPLNQITAGSAGATPIDTYTSPLGVVVPPKPVYHYSIIDVTPDHTTIKTITVDGETIDEFTLKNIY